MMLLPYRSKPSKTCHIPGILVRGTDFQAESQRRFFDHVLDIGPPIVETPDILRGSFSDIGGYYLIAVAFSSNSLASFLASFPSLISSRMTIIRQRKRFLTFPEAIFEFRYFHSRPYIAVFQSSQLHLDCAHRA